VLVKIFKLSQHFLKSYLLEL